MTDETVFIQIDKLREQNRELKKEIIKLKSLNRRAAEEIRDLDGILIDCIENNKVPKYDDPDPVMFAGFSSINLLNRLDGITNGGYIENYDDLHLQLKELDGWYQFDHPDFYVPLRCAGCQGAGCELCPSDRDEHSPECKWHKDWHACDCGAFDEEDDEANTCSFCGIRPPIREDNGVFICEKCDKRGEAMRDFKWPECGDPEFRYLNSAEFRCHHDEDEE
ncbi:MAG: hypothetical protein H8E74_02660 [Gammaproteobacteria bacterium]|jgi:ribosomal protein L37AE/L43A|nr:hypothetical protein [Gammaproteobacteria bacterium]